MHFLVNRVPLAKLASLVAIAIAALGLIGWQIDSTVLKSISPHWSAMKPNAALGIICAGVALLLISGGKRQTSRAIWGYVFAVASGLLGTLTMAEYLFDWNFGIDELLFVDDTNALGTSHPGRMSPFTALALLVLGCALLLLNRKPAVSQWLALTVGFMSLQPLIGYAYGVTEFYGLASFTHTAAHTAGAVLVLSVGVLFARPTTGPAEILTSDTPGASVFRRLWGATVPLLLVLGFLRLKGEKMGVVGPEFSTGVVVLALILLVSALLWRNARQLDRADAVRRERERELSEFFENAPFGLDLLSEQGVILQVNRTECEMLGYCRDELIARRLSDFLVNKGLATDLLDRCRRGENVRDFEVMFRRKDGSIAHVLINAQVRKEPGQPIRIAKSLQDITARRIAETQLDTRQRQQEALATLGNFAASQPNLKAVFDFSVNVIAQTLRADHCKILRLLENKRELLLESGVGWKEGLIGTATVPNDTGSQAGYTITVGEPVIVDDLRTETRFKGPSLLLDHEIISGMSVCIPAGEDAYGVLGVHTRSLRLFNPEDANFLQAAAHLLGSAIHAERERQLRQRAGELTELSSALETEVARRTAELQETIQFLEGFCYTIAHDLRAPLRAMQGFAVALLDDYTQQLDETAKTYAERIVSSSRRMDQLVLDLLDYGKLSHIALPKMPVDLAAEVHIAINDLSTEVAASGAQIEVQEPLPTVRGNPTVLRQVLLNLINNALKFVRPGVKPHVQIRAEQHDGWVRVTVQDNGIGIDPSLHAKIFRAFERLHTREAYPGTGIGLAIVQKGIERLGGHVGVESERGKGSCFWFELLSADSNPEQPDQEFLLTGSARALVGAGH